MKGHTDSHAMSCRKCHQCFQNPFFLGLHMAEHDFKQHVSCPLCNYHGMSVLPLKKHILNTHFEDDVEELKSEEIKIDDDLPEKLKKTDSNKTKSNDGDDDYDDDYLPEKPKKSSTKKTKLNDIDLPLEKSKKTISKRAKISRKLLERLRRERQTLKKREQRAKTQLICKICKIKYPTFKDLRNHRKVHKAERQESLYTYNPLRKSYSCDTCLQECVKEEEIKLHVETHTYSCDVCSVGFKKALLLGLHMAEHNEEAKISCPLCNHEFKTQCKSRLIRHIKQTHQKEKPKTSQCEYCGSSYLSKSMLEDHISVVHLQNEPFKCIVCGNTFTLQSSMRIHQINKHRVVDESELSSTYCTLCKMSFKKPESLAKHLEMKRCIPTPRVERQGHFVCDLCGKEFRFYKTFNLHQREHAGDKPYKCSFCPKAFVINSKRLAHEVSHSDLRPFSCETCGQNYKTWKHLRRHLVVHGTGASPNITFNCSFCDKEFSTKDTLRAHMRICTRPKPPQCY